MATPSGATVLVVSAGNDADEVTESVQVLYDLLLSSMDFGSGFLTIEDLEPIVKLATLCGFDMTALNEYLARERAMAENMKKHEAARTRQEAENIASGMNPLLGLPPHRGR